ncbi:MAG: DUF2139 domain-containing protein [Thermoproteota archaeon]
MCASTKKLYEQIPILPRLDVAITAAGGHGYLAIHPKLRELVFHDGACAKLYIGGKLVYKYEKCGPEPRAAGDTHGAMEVSRDRVFFGGWGEAPTRRDPDKQVFDYADRSGKFSHIHGIDENGKVELLWIKRWDEKIEKHYWYAEVTDLLYDPKKEVLWVTRGDVNWGGDQGLYMFDLSSGKMESIFFGNAYKMVMYQDNILISSWHDKAIYAYNPQKNQYESASTVPVFDGSNWEIPITFGGASFRVGSLPYVIQGPAIVSIQEWRMGSSRRMTAYPFFACYKLDKIWTRPGARAQKPVYINSSVLLPINTQETIPDDALNTPVLLRFDSVSPQIIMHSFYTSGMIFDGKHIYIHAACVNHEAILTWRSDTGTIFMLEPQTVLGKPLTGIRLSILHGIYKQSIGLNGWVGGIPLKGFINKKLRVKTPTDASMRIAHYILGSTDYTEFEDIKLKPGWNIVDLNSYDNIIAFKLDRDIEGIYSYVSLEP